MYKGVVAVVLLICSPTLTSGTFYFDPLNCVYQGENFGIKRRPHSESVLSWPVEVGEWRERFIIISSI
ncbi:hypothetical protein AHF37_06423 [Paragonimus kellicotti]|nr:hypothetical protein AHF37_06423 [Paragonimus kellicotti]